MNRTPLSAFVCRSVLAISLFLLPSIASNAQNCIFGRADFPVSNSPTTLGTGDFNSDGALDVAATSSYDNSVVSLDEVPA